MMDIKKMKRSFSFNSFSNNFIRKYFSFLTSDLKGFNHNSQTGTIR